MADSGSDEFWRSLSEAKWKPEKCPVVMRWMKIAAEIKAHKDKDRERKKQRQVPAVHVRSPSLCLRSAVVIPSLYPLFTALYWHLYSHRRARGRERWTGHDGEPGPLRGVWSHAHFCGSCVSVCFRGRSVHPLILWRISTEISDVDMFRFTWQSPAFMVQWEKKTEPGGGAGGCSFPLFPTGCCRRKTSGSHGASGPFMMGAWLQGLSGQIWKEMRRWLYIDYKTHLCHCHTQSYKARQNESMQLRLFWSSIPNPVSYYHN